MIFPAILALIWLFALVIVAVVVLSAPLGFEDDMGFHILPGPRDIP